MKKLLPYIVAALVLAMIPPEVSAQRGGRGGERGGGERGAGGGRGGGERGGPGGGFGGGPGGGQRGGPGGAAGGRGRGGARPSMDANGDGRLDAAELENMPDSMRTMMESRGIKIEPGGTMLDFVSKMRSGVESPPGTGEDFTRRLDEGSSTNRSRYSPPQAFRQRDREPLTKSLPEEYTELDIDYDGQIAMYEWMKTRRQEMDGFDARDSNRDGMLTPRELHAFSDLSEQKEPQVVSYTRDRLTIVGAGSGGSSASSKSKSKKGSKSLSKEEKAKHEQRGQFYLKYIDKNRDGKIEMSEWESNSRARGFMEAAGVKVEPMSSDDFIKRYVKIQADKAE